MPPEQDDNSFLWDMLDAAKTVMSFVENRSFPDYLYDRMLRSAVERQVQIIGEAARFVSEPFKLSHPEIPWHKIVAQRHVLADEYGDIEDKLIWKVATVHVPKLIEALGPLIAPLPPDTEG